MSCSTYRGPIWSTGGSTTTSTESRPDKVTGECKCGDFVAFPASGETTTSSTSRRIRTGTAGSGAVEFPSNSRSYRWARRRDHRLAERSRVEPEGYQRTASTIHAFLREYAGRVRRRHLPEVYRWSGRGKILREGPILIGGVVAIGSCANLNKRDRNMGWNPA
jgi:hypothetical protein